MILFRSRNRARCRELWAVLDAAGIPAAVDERYGMSCLVVPDADAARAVEELDDYRLELAHENNREEPRPLPTLRGGWIAMLVYGAALVTVAGLTDRGALDNDWFMDGRAQAGLLMNGQPWRAVTALTLHVDTAHLMGNLVFGSVLGLLCSQGLGGGVAWLAITVGGALGNLANAWIQNQDHSSVGASTAVFAALGILVALALRYRRSEASGAFRRWSPLVAGVLLLAWTGIGGERTDVTAHVTGLAAGVLVGAAFGFAPTAVLERRWVQALASIVALLLVVLAWMLALR